MCFSSKYPICSVSSVASPVPEVPLSDAIAYDYIIAGGGTAGCALASRLSEDSRRTVLLIERGEVVNTWKSKVPLLSIDYRPSGYPAYKWKSAPVAALQNEAFNMVSGKLLGGTSKINAHFYTRTTPSDHAAWTEAGTKGWAWDDVLPFYVKSEASVSHGDRAYRGSKGPWVNRKMPRVYFENTNHVLKVCPLVGLPQIEANNPSESPFGILETDMTIDSDGRRHSTFDAFLPHGVAAARAARLKICTGAVVQTLHFDQAEGKPRVDGVFLEQEDAEFGKRFFARARREVIVCSGAIGSPQVLLLSGIGPANHLQHKNIPIVKDLSGVGNHLQDHYGVSVIFRCRKNDTLHHVQDNPLVALGQFLRYLIRGDGLLLAPFPQMSIFAVSRLLDEESQTVAQDASDRDPFSARNRPDIEIMPIPYNASDWKFELGEDGCFSFLVVNLTPKSKGTVRLASTDPRIRPDCDLGSLQDPDDFVVMRKGIKLALRLASEMRKLGYRLDDQVVPKSLSDEDLDAFIVHGARTTYHYSSTCRIAPEAEGGVVDEKLRVHGVDGLRVADASVFPTIPSTHLQAPAVMVAERCAAFLQEGQ
ncbi:GMC oxidoreductase [Auriscalpium vulgare]|uniref:GMC oxidoreductase n=1 Tax=Auriscalpium vulgare TaxID=40419 RepID=A0ACB8RJE8_9AGAM|nr:GMC oxidoreductase [Auriscalpium vulgare]